MATGRVLGMGRRPLRRRTTRIGVAASTLLVLSATLVQPAVVHAATYDNTDPGTTACGNGSHTTYTLGLRTDMRPGVEVGQPTSIYYGSTGIKIGELEIRHSAYCGTVWSRVKNLTGGAVQAQETIYMYKDSNGTSIPNQETESNTISASGGTGWSNQFVDTASFQAEGKMLYTGKWYSAKTIRSTAWNQYSGLFPSEPYACNHTSYPCLRWSVKSAGVSATYYYDISTAVSHMPRGTAACAYHPTPDDGTCDVAPDVRYMFGQFNKVPVPSPFLYEKTAFTDAQVHILRYSEPGIVARGGGFCNAYPDDKCSSPSHVYIWGYLKLSDQVTWSSSTQNRTTFCHETDHLMGLNHVWYGAPISGPDNVGSKATCIGAGIPTGPSLDDVSALRAVYTGATP